MSLTNWAGNIAFSAARIHRPSTAGEVQEIVAGAERVRVLGTGYSFNRIADTPADLISLAGLPFEPQLDPAWRTVTVAAGVRYGELAAYLDARGYALHNFGSLPHISVAGAVATGTHGSGATLGNLATAVSGLQLVTADGKLLTLTRDDPDFAGCVVALGALGVVTSVTLDVVPQYTIRQFVFQDLPRRTLDAQWQEISTAGYSVSLFTDWSGDTVNQLWLKLTDGEEPHGFGARPAVTGMHPISNMPPIHCTEQLGVAGPSHTRLPHFKLEFTPSSGEELQSEFFVARSDAVEAFAAVERLRHLLTPVLQVSEVRVVAADDLWLSPHYQRDSVALHFTWIKDPQGVRPVVDALEAALTPLASRPHWGKVFGQAARPERLADFLALRDRLDPQGKFTNAFVERHLTAG